MAELLPKLDDSELASIDAWWRANNYLTVGMIYLQANPLLRETLKAEHIKPRLLGHWGTSPGLAFIWAHTSRLIKRTGQQCLYITGPGHGGPSIVGASYLEGTYTPAFPYATQDAEGMLNLFRTFSAPGGIPSHASVTTPGSIHEGGELGYALIHAFGSVFDNPDLLTVAVVGDGEAETGPLEGSWKGISFLNPEHDGAVLPILHLNGGKIAAPTVLARKPREEVRSLFQGHGYEVIEVEGDDTPGMHHRFAEALSQAYAKIKDIQEAARNGTWDGKRPVWPMIILRSPKGWTGPKEFHGKKMEGTWRSHQVPLSGVKNNPDDLEKLEEWMRSYKPEELFNEDGSPSDLVRAANPDDLDLTMSGTPHANGGRLMKPLVLPDYRAMALEVKERATEKAESTRKLGEFMRELYRNNPDNFRLFCPDETNSNRLGAVFEVSDRTWLEEVIGDDEKLSKDGRVMEVLSEHLTHGWLEAYNLTGRHGLFATYEAFAMVSASQTIQHGKWLQEADELSWRESIPSLNILVSSTAWRNDHNGFSHQGPGMLQLLLNMGPKAARVYLPPDANSLLVVSNHVFQSTVKVNLIVQDKQPQPQWLSMDEAEAHFNQGASVWDWAGNEDGSTDPDIVLACAGDVMTMETVAAAEILKEKLPALRTRVVNVVNLMTLRRPKDHPEGMSPTLFRELFTDTQDVVFAFHGYPGGIHQLMHGRPDQDRFRVRGFIEQGTTTTPFDMVVKNRASRYHLVMDAINNAKHLPRGAEELKLWCESQLERHESYIREHLEDMPEVRNWKLGEL